MNANDVWINERIFYPYALYEGYYLENILYNPIEKTSIDQTRDIKKMSRVIEALILGIPFGEIVMSTTGDYNMIVITKQFELYALFKFFENDYKLEGLEIRSDLNGSTWKDLKAMCRRRVAAATLKCHEIDKCVPDDVRSYLIEYLKTL